MEKNLFNVPTSFHFSLPSIPTIHFRARGNVYIFFEMEYVMNLK
jgi:hypothetical protein